MRGIGDGVVKIFSPALCVAGALEIVTNCLVPIFDKSPVETHVCICIKSILQTDFSPHSTAYPAK